MEKRTLHLPATLALILVTVLTLTGFNPPIGHTTWLLEVLPVLVALVVCAATHKRFALSNGAYVCIFVHALVLMYGGYYGYAHTPLGDWVKTAFDLQRNPYDRLGHLAQGALPTYLIREVLLRRTPLTPGAWLNFLVVSVALAISALYELCEWWVAIATADGSTEFLGTQGDPWDTQWDMFCALIGSTLMAWALSRHSRRHRA